MTNIQILFFCGLSVLFIGVMFVMLWKMHKLKLEMSNLEASHKDDYEKLKNLSNKIYEKLKEVVEKVNPLLAANVESPNGEVFEAEYAEEANGDSVEGE